MKMINRFKLVFAIMVCSTFSANAQQTETNIKKTKTSTEMKTFVIEREIPGAGSLNAEQLKSVSQTSCAVLKEMGPKIEWVHSYVTGNKIYCIYKAENAELVREHAKKGGFPANSVEEVSTVISPATATAN